MAQPAENTTAVEDSHGPCIPPKARCPLPDLNKKTSTYFPNACHCTKFFECSNGRFYSFNCPAHLHFNPRKDVCDWPYRAGCHTHCIRRGYACDRHTEPCCRGLVCRRRRDDDVGVVDDVDDAGLAAADAGLVGDIDAALIGGDDVAAGDVDHHGRRGHCLPY